MLPLTIRTFAKGVPWNLFLLTVGCALFAFGVKATSHNRHFPTPAHL